MDGWFIFLLGISAQILFSARMLVQWLMSERSRRVVSPLLFWVLSLAASLIFFVYGWLRSDFAIMLGQVIGYYAYLWNLKLKGAFSPMGKVPGHALLTALILFPVLGITTVALRNPDAAAALFSGENIHRGVLLFGTVGQLIFSTRFIYQTLYSARRGESILPPGFWRISLAGALLILAYGIMRLDAVVILAQSFGILTYVRNLVLWRKSHR